ncbi:MAG: Signal transduction histidine kinase [Rhodospirillales bacterium]|nr:Signal transduction histidine kinase [Rhodospirillales bacterium]
MTALVGTVSLTGWWLWRPLLGGTWHETTLPMSPTTALLFIILGGALASLPGSPITARTLISSGFGAGVALSGLLCLADLLFGWNVHFDRWLLHDWLDQHGVLLRSGVSPLAAAAFALTGSGLILIDTGGRVSQQVGQAALILTLLIAITPLSGYVYQALGLYEVGRLLPMALNTSINFLLVSIGVLMLRPEAGFVAILTASNLGGVMARRLFGAVIILPPLLGFVCLRLMRWLAIDPAGGVGLLVTLTGLALAVAVLVTAHRLEKTAETLTERSRELELARQEAETANRTKSEFLANMSHELRTPLNAVIGFSEIMRDARFGPLAERYREYSGDVFDSGVHLLAVVNQILDLAKIEAGQLTLNEDEVDFPDVVGACMTLVKEKATGGGVALMLDLPSDLPTLHADQTRLKQIVLNLLSNAVKFTGADGKVTLSARVMPDGSFEISIEDTGIGMTEQELAVAFLPFRQVDSSLSRRYEGTGLGLPFAKALAEQHGGTLTLESCWGAGTTAYVRLPPYRVARGQRVSPIAGAS